MGSCGADPARLPSAASSVASAARTGCARSASDAAIVAATHVSPPSSPTSTMRRAASHVAKLRELKSRVAKSSAMLRRIGSPRVRSPRVRFTTPRASWPPPVVRYHQDTPTPSLVPRTSAVSCAPAANASEPISAAASSVGGLRRSISCSGGGGEAAAPFCAPPLPTPLRKPTARRTGALGSALSGTASASELQISQAARRQPSPELTRAALERPVAAAAMSAAWAAKWAASEARSALSCQRVSPTRGNSAGALGDARRRGAALGFVSSIDKRPVRPWTGQTHQHAAPLVRQTQQAMHPKAFQGTQRSSHRPRTSPSARRASDYVPHVSTGRPMTAGSPPPSLSVAGHRAFPGGPRQLFSD